MQSGFIGLVFRREYRCEQNIHAVRAESVAARNLRAELGDAFELNQIRADLSPGNDLRDRWRAALLHGALELRVQDFQHPLDAFLPERG